MNHLTVGDVCAFYPRSSSFVRSARGKDEIMSTQDKTVETNSHERLFYSLKETAAMLGVAYRTMQDWQYKRCINTVKLGWRVMVPATEIERILVEGVPLAPKDKPKGKGSSRATSKAVA
ncbi:hypothetical protein HMPREF0580_0209 [Mobiluncus mulieris ATCC 35239]|uniref:Helix-turn-helix domain-containing protein n=2 Tax=Mobiluncus mulieris TaxID=2052 RepID=E0QMU5_9ACTO|nr:hypothetical protein HMPREF0580_0209 [Mobiluncus mulieris ATCC 35239]